MTDDNSNNNNSSIPAARNNNLVAESDLASAFQALEHRFEGKIAAAAAVSDKSTVAVQQQLFQDCQNSLSANIQRIVQQVSDEAFHEYVYQQTDHTIANDTNSETSFPKKTPVLTATTTQPDDPEWDEDDLVDEAALERACELRDKVRLSGASTKALQQAVLAKAVTVAERQVQLWKRKSNVGSSTNENIHNINISDDITPVMPPAYVEKIQEMQTSLADMTAALQKADIDLPDKLTSLQKQCAVVQAYLETSNNNKSLSKTEQAIRARDYSHGTSSSMTLSGAGTTAKTMEPAVRLANFLRSE
jgi:hypothetical protein